MSNGDLKKQLADARRAVSEAATPAQRMGAQRRLNSIKRAAVTAGVDTTTARPAAPRPAPRPAAKPDTIAKKSPARAPTLTEQLRERAQTERELGIRRGRVKGKKG